MQSYNGYTAQERLRKSRALHDAILDGEVREPWPPCQLCGDPEVTCDYHSEDYSRPYGWRPPAMYSVCTYCHNRLHKRFTRPDLWDAFKAHVRRGGYAADLRDPEIAREFQGYRRARARGKPASLRRLRRYRKRPGTEWWARLSIDPRVLTARSARPRS
jgi:hypothetical protein